MPKFKIWMAPASVVGVVMCSSAVLADDTAVTTSSTKKAEFGDFYIGTDIGVSIMPSVKIKDYAPSSGEFGISGVEADTSAGVAWNLDFGFKFNDFFAVEIETGYIRNDFDGFASGQFDSKLGSAFIYNGDGNFAQIPLFVNGKFSIPLTKSEAGSDAGALKLELMAGVGMVNVSADISNIYAFGVPDVAATVDGNSWEFGGQVGVGLVWEMSPTIDLGLSYRFMAVSGANFGPATFSDPSLVGIADIETESVFTHAIQASLSFEF